MRTAVLWFPDWPVVAVRRAHGEAHSTPVIIAQQHAVYACCGAARAHGIRRAMRLRHARALAPEALVFDRDDNLAARMFEPIVQSLSHIAATCEVLRPGLLALNMDAVQRYYKKPEDTLAQMLIDASASAGVDCFIGIADTMHTALIAARQQHIVPPGGCVDFLAQQPVGALHACDEEGTELPGLLTEMGIRTLGQFVELGRTGISDIASRFGAAGIEAYEIATARAQRDVITQEKQEELAVFVEPESPITRVDEAAFIARTLASQLHEKLAAAGVVCDRVKIRAYSNHDDMHERVWRTRDALTEAATAERVRWQLAGWVSGPLRAIELIPLSMHTPSTRSVLDDDAADDSAVARAIATAQAQWGAEQVMIAHAAGGRCPTQRVDFLPYGDRPLENECTTTPWAGAIPGPHPSRILSKHVDVVDYAGQAVIVNAEAELNTPVAALIVEGTTHAVTAWAGPWAEDTGWWTATPTRRAFLHVATSEQALLLTWSDGRWILSGAY